MTTPIFKLTKGARNFDLQTGRYRVYGGWAPPPVSEIPLFAEGTSANRGGAVLVDRRPVNRQMSLRLNVLGSSDAEIRRAVADLQMMLSLAGDEYEPLYLEFRPNSDTPEPLWGNYGSNLRYEIVHGAVEIEQTYLVGARLAADTDVVMTLAVKPYALGRAQRLGSALGGIVENVIGAPDGLSRGLTVAEATTNKMTSPTFSHATWSTGWTADAGVTATQGTDPVYGFGASYAVLASGTGSVAWRYYQNINVGNTNTHTLSCYARRPDGAAITSSDVKLYYNADLTTTFTAVGNGVYRLTASASGINASTVTGVDIQAGGVLLAVWGFQLEEKAYVTELAAGDMIGCAWTGTAHASTSTRTAAYWRIADTSFLPRGTGSVRLAWTPHRAATSYSAVCMLLDSTATNWRVYFNNSDDKFYFVDGTVTLSSAAQTFAADSKQVLHMVFTRGEMTLYINGAQAATFAGYTAPVTGGYIYLGCNSSTAQHANGALTGLASWDIALTAAQVLADYTNIAQLTGDNQSVGTIPWLWTKDGDDVVDNCDDSTRDNWAVAGGVPGGADADTEYSAVTNATSGSTVNIGVWQGDAFVPPATAFVFDQSGTVDATASGGETRVTSIDSSSDLAITAVTGIPSPFSAVSGREFYAIARMKDAGSNLRVRLRLNLAYDIITAEYGNGLVEAYHRNLLFPSLQIPRITTRDYATTNWYLYLTAIRSTGGASDVTVDFLCLMPRPLAKIHMGEVKTTWKGRSYETAYTASNGYRSGQIEGDVIDLAPGRINIMLVSMQGENYAAANNSVASTVTFGYIKVTPRYPLL